MAIRLVLLDRVTYLFAGFIKSVVGLTKRLLNVTLT